MLFVPVLLLLMLVLPTHNTSPPTVSYPGCRIMPPHDPPTAAPCTHAGECLGGALYEQDFLRLARGVGFGDPRRLASNPIEIRDEELAELLGRARFTSATYR
jgi:hypothetical protein